MIQIAIEASKCGMRAIAFKDHWNISATSAYLTQRHIDDMIARGELTHRVEVYGGVGMCFGMRPDYVRVGLQYPNFKMIWFPSFTSYGFWRSAGHPDHEGVRLCSEDGKVLPEVKQIMEMAAEKKSASASATPISKSCCRWPSWPKRLAIARRSTIPLLELNKLLLDEMKQLRDLGVYVGTYCQPMIPSLYQPVATRWKPSARSKKSAPTAASSAATSARYCTWMPSTACACSCARC
jgi:hypothetical protein